MKKAKEAVGAILLTLKLILVLDDNWKMYQTNGLYKVRNIEKREVEKMLSCMEAENGYSTYMCPGCGYTKVVAHSCKSRICSRCGKKHADEWSEKISKEMYAVPYRHIILTISNRLWNYFEGNSDLQKLMLDTAAKVMKEIVRNFNNKRKKVEPGLIMVLHPFGGDLKTNMHVHMLMTEGGLTSNGEWIAMPYINYKIIRKKWQYGILTAMKKALPKDRKLAQIINWCFKERTNGFNIQAKRRIEGKTKQAARYMARYVRHPAIADSRIINYDGKNVTFVYEREGCQITVTVDKFEFIHNVVKHIPSKNFKMVRYFGIHGRKAKKSVRETMERLGLLVKHIIRSFSWRKNVKEHTGKDPLECDKCGSQMELYRVIYKDKNGNLKEYGGLEVFLRKITKGSRQREKEKKEKAKKTKNKQAAAYHQLCMF